jgi:hypothetical protein
MKRYVSLLLFVLFCNALCAQDLIVTKEQDSINCQISLISDKFIYFSVIKNHEKINSSLPLEQVVSYLRGYYPVIPQKTEKKFAPDNYATFRVAVVAGYNYRFAEYNHGFNYGAELNYFFKESLGIGLCYTGNHFFQLNLSWKLIHIHNVIPTFNVRLFDSKKQSATLIKFGIGYTYYNGEYCYRFFDFYQHIKEWEGIGMLIGAGYDLPFSKTMAVCFQLSFATGIPTKFDDNLSYWITRDFDGGSSRFIFSIGLRFAK